MYYLESGDNMHLPKLPVPLPAFKLGDIFVRISTLSTKHEPLREVTQLVIHDSWTPKHITDLHASPQAGYPSKARSLHHATLEYYLPTMLRDINSFIGKCQTWAEYKGSEGCAAPLKNYPIPREPWETIAIDLSNLPMTTESHHYLLVPIDHFSRFAILVHLRDKTAKSVATALTDEVFCKFNSPEVFISDNGAELNNQILNQLCIKFQIKKCNFIAYHPASNGMVERQNRKIIENLGPMIGDMSYRWHEWMPQVAASLNSSLHSSIGDTTSYIVFGQDKRLPYSVSVQKDDPAYNFDNYVRVRSLNFSKTYKKVQKHIAEAQKAMNQQHNKNASHRILVIGDVICIIIHEGENKLASHFEGPKRVIGYDQGNKIKL